MYIETLAQLVHYFKYASSAYSLVCPRPNGNHLVAPVRYHAFSSALIYHVS